MKFIAAGAKCNNTWAAERRGFLQGCKATGTDKAGEASVACSSIMRRVLSCGVILVVTCEFLRGGGQARLEDALVVSCLSKKE